MATVLTLKLVSSNAAKLRWVAFGRLRGSVVVRNNDILNRLVLEAKREYEKDAEHRGHIFMADT